LNEYELLAIGIIGAGTMGSRIAYQCALHGKEVYLFDISPKEVQRALEEIQTWLSEREEPETANLAITRIHSCSTLKDCVANVELVIETVPEILDLKRQIFAEIDRMAPPNTLIATNSSSLPSSLLATVTSRPDKVFNINFNDPIEGELIVEVMGHADTSEETVNSAEALISSIELVPIIAKREIMGFVFNRIWRAIKKESLHLVGNGYADFEDIDRAWILTFGSKRGPFARMDEIGLEVIRDIETQYYLESGDQRDKPPEFLEEMISQGKLGVKNGQGFYQYPEPEYKQDGWLYKK